MIKHEVALQESRIFVSLAEESLGSLMAQIPAAPTEDARGVLSLIRAAARLAHAYQTYPVFDRQCLSLMREDAELGLCVPKFAFADLRPDITFDLTWRPTSRAGLVFHADMMVYYPEELIARNERAIDGPPSSDSFTATNGFTIGPSKKALAELEKLKRRLAPISGPVRLVAAAPAIPASVQRRIEAAAPEFDAMKLVWEAEWRAAPVKDPLVIGVLGDKCFLVDQYDVTRLERYIVSEMCQGPEGAREP